MSTKRSYKAEFLRWKAEVEKKHGKMIYDRLSEVIDTDDDLAVGDTVLFTNDYGVTFGPHEVLGFCRPDSFLCPHRYPEDEDCGIVFSDNDAYWFPDRPVRHRFHTSAPPFCTNVSWPGRSGNQ